MLITARVMILTDDIIRLNKKEQQLRRQANVNRRPVKKKGRLIQGKGVSQRTAGPAQRGVFAYVFSVIISFVGMLLFFTPVETSVYLMSLFQYLPGGGIPRGGGPKLRNRKVPPIVARRRGQGVITGLAARRPAALLKRAGTLNRSAFNQVLEDCTGGDMSYSP